MNYPVYELPCISLSTPHHMPGDLRHKRINVLKMWENSKIWIRKQKFPNWKGFMKRLREDHN